MRAAPAPALALALAALVAPAAPAAAQSTFERYEATTVAMTERLFAALVARIPALQGNLPDAQWDAPMREAYTCLYDTYVAEAGEAPVAAMVAEYEALLTIISDDDLLDGGAALTNPDGISDERALAILTECRVLVAFMSRMADSGAAQILMQQR